LYVKTPKKEVKDDSLTIHQKLLDLFIKSVVTLSLFYINVIITIIPYSTD